MNCQHHRIDNATWQCVDCGETMLVQHAETETVLSAPNLAAGSGTYVADMAHAKRIPIGRKFTYECDRCRYDGEHVSEDGVVPSCGRVHRGSGQ